MTETDEGIQPSEKTREVNQEKNPDVTKLAKGAITNLLGKFGGQATYFIAQVVLARLLRPDAFGLYAIGLTIANMVGIVAPFGLHNGIIRFASDYWRRDDVRLKSIMLQGIGLALLSGLVLGLTFFATAPWLATRVFNEPELVIVIRLFAVSFPLISGVRVAAAATRVSQRMEYSVYVMDFAQPVGNLLLVVLFYSLGWHVLGAVGATVASYALAFGLAVYYVVRLFPEVLVSQPKVVNISRKLLVYSMPTAMAGLFSMLIFRIDRLLIGYFLPSAEVGVYQAASQSATMFAIILSAFNLIFTPMIADLYHDDEIERLEELYKVSTKWGLYVSLPIYTVLLFAPQDFMVALFGSGYASGAVPMLVLATAQLINTGTGAVGLMLMMTGHERQWFLISAAMFVVNVILSFLLIPRLGITGAALGSGIAIIGLFVSGLLRVKGVLGLWPYDLRYLKGIIAVLASAGALTFYSALSNIDIELIGLIVTGIISCSIFACVLFLLGLDEEDKKTVNLILRRARQFA